MIALLLRPPPTVEVPTHEAPPERVVPIDAPQDRVVATGGTARGRVVHGVTKAPLPGAIVFAVRPYIEEAVEPGQVPLWGKYMKEPGTEVITGPDGAFAIENLPQNYWSLWAEKEGFSFGSVAKVRFDREHVIELFPGAEVFGRVVFPDGSPAPDVRVEYTPTGERSIVFQFFRRESYVTQTDAGGRFRFTGLPPGTFTVEVYPVGYLPAPWTMEPPLAPGERRDLKTRRLDAGFQLAAKVLWRGGEEPVPGVEVVAIPVNDPNPRTRTGVRTRTDAKGVARFSGLGGQALDTPRFQVTVNDPNTGPVSPDEPRLYAAGEEVVFHLRKTGSIRGKVLDPSGEPVERFFVRLDPTEGPLQYQRRGWGAKGEFRLTDVHEGRYRLVVIFAPFQDEAVEDVAIDPGRETDIGLVRMRPGAEIAGTVRYASGKAIKDTIAVHLGRKRGNAYEPVRHANCRPDGSYRLFGIPPGSYHIWPETMLRTTEPKLVEIPEGVGFLQIDLVIEGEGFLDLAFLDYVEGRLVPVVQPEKVFLLEESNGREHRWLGSGYPLRPGWYTASAELVRADGTTGRFRLGRFEVKDEQTTGPITISLPEVRDGG